METSIVNNEQGLQGSVISGKTRILLVDDEKNILSSLAELLGHRYREYLIGTAESAEEAMDIVRSTNIDVLVTDFRLPRMNGLELAQTLKEISPKTQSILITAYGADTVIHKAQQSGCVAYLEKPLDLSLLCEYIDKATDNRHRFYFGGAQFALPDVVQFYAMKKDNVVLSVTTEDRVGMLAIEKGLLVHAQFGALEGLQALLELMQCSGATLATIYCGAPIRRTLALTWFALGAAFEARDEEERIKLLSNQSKKSSRDSDRQSGGRSEAEEASIAELIAEFKLKNRRTSGTMPTVAEPPREAASAPTLEEDGPDRFRAPELDLSLEPEERVLSTEEDAEVQQRRALHLRELVNEGIRNFRAHRLDKAKQLWLEALKLDPDCVPAKENLKILEDLLAYSSVRH